MRLSIIFRNRLRAVPIGPNTTTEIFIDPAEATLAESNYILRVSRADLVEGGPFSDKFRGYQRILMLLSGGGVQLNIFDQENCDPRVVFLAGPGQKVTFSGNARVESSLTRGPVRDFNVIYREDKVALPPSAHLLCCAEKVERIPPLLQVAQTRQIDIFYSLGGYRLKYDMRQVEAAPEAAIILERQAGDPEVPISVVRADTAPIAHTRVFLPA